MNTQNSLMCLIVNKRQGVLDRNHIAYFPIEPFYSLTNIVLLVLYLINVNLYSNSKMRFGS